MCVGKPVVHPCLAPVIANTLFLELHVLRVMPDAASVRSQLLGLDGLGPGTSSEV